MGQIMLLQAGIVDRSEDYRWSSLGYHIQTENKDRFLFTDFGLKEFSIKSKNERIRRYRRYVYEAGALDRPDKMQAQVIDAKVVAKERWSTYRCYDIDSDRFITKLDDITGVLKSSTVSCRLEAF